MSNNTLMMAIIATLHPVAATPRALPSFVGIMGQYTPSNTASQNVPLPSGAVAGDVMVAALATGAVGYSLVAPADAALVINNESNGYVVSQGFFQFCYLIKPADVAQGYVTVAVSASGFWVVDAAVFRNVDPAQLLDAPASVYLHTASTTATPMHMVVPGLTTASDNAMLVFATFPGGTNAINGTTEGWGALPGGFTEAFRTGSGAHANSRYNMLYKAQASLGATGDVAQDFNWTDDSRYPNTYTGSLIALRGKPDDATFRITGTLPAGTVGSAYSGTLTFAGDFTAPLTFSGLPAWMGTPTIDYTAKTATWNGTPVEGSYTFTPAATDANSQVATGAEQTVVVSAASADITPVQVIGLNGAGTKSVVFNSSKGWNAPKPGNLLIAMAVVSSSGATKPTGFTDLLTGGTSTRAVMVWYKFATGSETSVTIGAFGGWLLEVPTTAVPASGDAMQQSYASAFTYNLGPLTPSVGKCLAIGAAAWNIANQGGWTTDAGWTLKAEGDGVSFGSALVFKVLDASLAPTQVSITGTKSVAGGAAFMLVKP